jgi:hypothetical protein
MASFAYSSGYLATKLWAINFWKTGFTYWTSSNGAVDLWTSRICTLGLPSLSLPTYMRSNLFQLTTSVLASSTSFGQTIISSGHHNEHNRPRDIVVCAKDPFLPSHTCSFAIDQSILWSAIDDLYTCLHRMNLEDNMCHRSSNQHWWYRGCECPAYDLSSEWEQQ